MGWWLSFGEGTTAVTRRGFHTFGEQLSLNCNFSLPNKNAALEISQRSPGWERGGCRLLLIPTSHQRARAGEGRRYGGKSLGSPVSNPDAPTHQLPQLPWPPHQVPPKLCAIKQPIDYASDAVGQECRQSTSATAARLCSSFSGASAGGLKGRGPDRQKAPSRTQVAIGAARRLGLSFPPHGSLPVVGLCFLSACSWFQGRAV